MHFGTFSRADGTNKGMAGLSPSIRTVDLEEYLMVSSKLKFAALFAGAAMIAISGAPAGAATVGKAGPSVAQNAAGTSDATDFSSQRRRYYGGRYYGRRGIGPGVAAGALAAGVIGSAIIASQPRRYYYDDGYYGGPRYYRGPGYGYYDGGW
jgi:hypothetical protein